MLRAAVPPVMAMVRVLQVLLWLMVVLVMPMVRVLLLAALGAGLCVAQVWSWSWSLASVRRGPSPFLAEGLAGGVAGSLWCSDDGKGFVGVLPGAGVAVDADGGAVVLDVAEGEGAVGDLLGVVAAGVADDEGAPVDAPGVTVSKVVVGGVPVVGAVGDAVGEGAGCGSGHGLPLAGAGRGPSPLLAEGLVGGAAG